MDNILEEYERDIQREIRSLTIDCPACKYMYDDPQYTCTTCWCEGGDGKLNVLSYIKENLKSFKINKT